MPNSYHGPDRRCPIPALTKDDLKEVISAAMTNHLLSDQHQFIVALIKKEQRQQELWEKIKAHVVGWGAVAVIIFVANSLWHEIMAFLPFTKGH